LCRPSRGIKDAETYKRNIKIKKETLVICFFKKNKEITPPPHIATYLRPSRGIQDAETYKKKQKETLVCFFKTNLNKYPAPHTYLRPSRS